MISWSFLTKTALDRSQYRSALWVETQSISHEVHLTHWAPPAPPIHCSHWQTIKSAVATELPELTRQIERPTAPCCPLYCPIEKSASFQNNFCVCQWRSRGARCGRLENRAIGQLMKSPSWSYCAGRQLFWPDRKALIKASRAAFQRHMHFHSAFCCHRGALLWEYRVWSGITIMQSKWMI